MQVPQEVKNAQAIFVNHSGGKDSQAMLAYLISLGLKEKLVVVHSDLGEMEWEPMSNFISNVFNGRGTGRLLPKEALWFPKAAGSKNQKHLNKKTKK